MDSQFNTLIQSYRDNLLEYKFTSNVSYQNAYSTAKEGIDNILTSLRNEVENNQTHISNFYNDDMNQAMKTLRKNTVDSKLELTSSNDVLETAKMRNPDVPSPFSTSDLTYYYYGIGIMTAILLGLSIS